MNGGIGRVANSLSGSLGRLLVCGGTISENTGSNGDEELTCCAETVDLEEVLVWVSVSLGIEDVGKFSYIS